MILNSNKKQKPIIVAQSHENTTQKSNKKLDLLKIEKTPPASQKKPSKLRRSLIPEFDEIEVEPKDSAQPAENCNKALEDLISSISSSNPLQQLKKPTPPAMKLHPVTSTAQNQGQPPSMLANQIKQILYSKPMVTYADADSDEDEDEKEEVSNKKSTTYYSFEHPSYHSDGDEDKENININLPEFEQYDLTDYSDNSSSNDNSYVYHEEEESIDAGPNKNPPLFNFFDTVNFTFKDNFSQQQPNIDLNQGRIEGFCSQITSGSNNLFTSTNGVYGSQETNPEFMFDGEERGPQNTMQADYFDFLKQKNNKNWFELPKNTDDEDDMRERRLSKLVESPIKSKAKRLYCNDKRIPMWCTNLKEVEKTSRDQKKMFNANHIFGFFNVDNLDLVEVFQRRDPRLLKARYCSFYLLVY